MLLPNGPYEMVLRSMVEALEADAGAGGLSTDPPRDRAAILSSRR